MNRAVTSRRAFVGGLAASWSLGYLFPHAELSEPTVVKPPRLRPGDTVGLVNPAGATFVTSDLQPVRESLAALGLACREGAHVLDRYGYLAGRDEDRARDVQEMFMDDAVRAVMAVRGGWGCARILPLLNYEVIRRHPKILIGYSDITALLLAVYARSGLTTFHGPVGVSTWNRYSVENFKKVLFDGEAITYANPSTVGDNLTRTKDRVETIVPGTARGVLIGGNLSVLAGIIGTDFVPRWKGAILFLEDDGEHIYRIDRMLTQLKLAGVLQQLGGFIFGKCTNCSPGEGYGSLTLEEVMNDHIKPLGIPAWAGAMIGHIENKWTLPIGIMAEIDASAGTIRLIEPAVM